MERELGRQDRAPSWTPVVIPNYALGYLASSLRQAGHDVLYADCVKERWSTDDFANWVKHLDKKPDMVGYQAFSFDGGATWKLNWVMDFELEP